MNNDVIELTNDLLDIKSVQSMLSAVFDATQDAISVVNVNGEHILVNPAYTKITGLNASDILGKSATADIAEGESVHLKVLATGEAVKGEFIKVGPLKKEVLVNAAPIIVDSVLKGSVGVLHDITEMNKLGDELKNAKRIIRNLEAKYSFEDIIGEEESILLAIEKASKAAQTPATVLLRGESGTGKEIFAHAIHNASGRKYNQFVKVNCAAISNSLLESEIFGYEDGAFTGAAKGGKKGLFEEADKGTIFLDEIGELPLATQAKLLRVLQEKEFIRVGGNKAVSVDVRVIAATNINIEEAIEKGLFRKDLYYRLNIFPVDIPPLSERKGDIPALITVIIQKFNQEYGRNISGIGKEAVKILMNNHWAGNVRELQNVIGSAIINMKTGEKIIELKHLPNRIIGIEYETEKVEGKQVKLEGKTLEEVLSPIEKEYIIAILKDCQGNKTKASKKMNISVRGLYYKMEKHNIPIA